MKNFVWSIFEWSFYTGFTVLPICKDKKPLVYHCLDNVKMVDEALSSFCVPLAGNQWLDTSGWTLLNNTCTWLKSYEHFH